MAELEVDALLERMSKIAAAVNAFKSESVQQAAFAALVSAFEAGTSPRVAHTKPIKPEPAESSEETNADDAGGASKRRRRPRGTAASNGAVSPVKDLDLRPKGQESFDDFVAKKQPGDNQEKFAVAVYYLEQVANVSPITLGHLAAVFKQTSGWREPTNLKSGVQMTGFRKNTIDTSDTSNLRTTPHGRNFVEHDLPAKPKK